MQFLKWIDCCNIINVFTETVYLRKSINSLGKLIPCCLWFCCSFLSLQCFSSPIFFPLHPMIARLHYQILVLSSFYISLSMHVPLSIFLTLIHSLHIPDSLILLIYYFAVLIWIKQHVTFLRWFIAILSQLSRNPLLLYEATSQFSFL